MDAEFSFEQQEMKQLVKKVNAAYDAIGSVHYGLTSQESTKFRRSLYIVEDMKAGDVITEKICVVFVRDWVYRLNIMILCLARK